MKRLLACFVYVCLAPLGGCGDDPITPPPLTPIQGRVEDTHGQPVEGIVVLIGDKAPVSSDTEGSFRVDAVGSTYDITLLYDTTLTRSYSGVTRRDPFLRVPTRGSTSHLATITGTVPTAPDKTTRLHFAPSTFGRATANPTTGGFQLYVDWFAPGPTVEGSLFVFRWSVGTDGLPVEYDAFARRPLVLTAGTNVVQEFTPADFTDPPEAQVSGAVTIPSGYELAGISTRMHIGPESFWFVGQERSMVSGSAFQYTLPILPDAFFAIEAFAQQGAHHTILLRNNVVPPAAEILLDLPASPRIVEPPHGASNVDYSTLFQWEEGGGTGSYAVFINQYGGPRLEVYLSGTSTRIPDLRQYGLGLRSGAFCEWVVYKLFPLSSIDALLSPTYGLSVEPEEGNAHSASNQFTMAP